MKRSKASTWLPEQSASRDVGPPLACCRRRHRRAVPQLPQASLAAEDPPLVLRRHPAQEGVLVRHLNLPPRKAKSFSLLGYMAYSPRRGRPQPKEAVKCVKRTGTKQEEGKNDGGVKCIKSMGGAVEWRLAAA